MLELVIEQLQETLDSFDITLSKDIFEDTKLYGNEGILNSMELVSFLADLECLIEERHQKNIQLMSEEILHLPSKPFETVSNLVSYLKSKWK